jgi:hypothetical protein
MATSMIRELCRVCSRSAATRDALWNQDHKREGNRVRNSSTTASATARA